MCQPTICLRCKDADLEYGNEGVRMGYVYDKINNVPYLLIIIIIRRIFVLLQ